MWDQGEALLQQRPRINPQVSATGNATLSRYVSFGANGRSLLLNGAFQDLKMENLATRSI
jgi:hypothetical protein